MLLLAFLVILICGIGLAIGNAVLTRLDPWQYFDRPGDRAVVATWIGVLILANFFLVISLFRPLSLRVATPATLLLLGLSLCSAQNRRDLGGLARRAGSGTVVGLLVLTVGVGSYCSQVLVWYDSGLYHVQVIKWLSKFGLVPGLALFHGRFGVISSWFALPAPLNHGLFQGRISTLPGALCLLLLLSHLAMAIERIIARRGRRSDLFLTAASLLAVAVLLAWGLPNSPSPDFPVIVLAIVVAWSLMTISCRENTLKKRDDIGRVALVPLVLAVGAITIKLSALPLVVIAGCLCLFWGGFSIKRLVAVGSLVVLPLLPVAAAGIVTSGCAFYPASALCFDLPWSLGAATAAAEAKVIQGWARWAGATPEQATAWNWVLPWLQHEKVFAGLTLLSLLAVLSLLFRRRAVRTFRQYAPLMILGGFGIGFTLYLAPTWRFGLGYLIVSPALAAADFGDSLPAIVEIFSNIKGLGFNYVCLALAIPLALHVYVLQRPSYRRLDEAVADHLVTGEEHPHFNLLLPPHVWKLVYERIPTTGTIETFKGTINQHHTGRVKYYRSKYSNACWDAPLPCSPYQLQNLKFHLPAEGLRAGVEKINPELPAKVGPG